MINKGLLRAHLTKFKLKLPTTKGITRCIRCNMHKVDFIACQKPVDLTLSGSIPRRKSEAEMGHWCLPANMAIFVVGFQTNVFVYNYLAGLLEDL